MHNPPQTPLFFLQICAAYSDTTSLISSCSYPISIIVFTNQFQFQIWPSSPAENRSGNFPKLKGQTPVQLPTFNDLEPHSGNKTWVAAEKILVSGNGPADETTFTGEISPLQESSLSQNNYYYDARLLFFPTPLVAPLECWHQDPWSVEPQRRTFIGGVDFIKKQERKRRLLYLRMLLSQMKGYSSEQLTNPIVFFVKVEQYREPRWGGNIWEELRFVIELSLTQR